MDFNLDLNENQQKAVTTAEQNVRVIAGAGSGKTRVLTYRIAYLMGECHVSPYHILAISFTNKVAQEMQERLENLLPGETQGLIVKTFHALATYILRIEIEELDYPRNFTILDDDDETRIIKNIAKDHGYKKSDEIVKKTIEFIETSKLKEQHPEDIKTPQEEDKKHMLEIYEEYEAYKRKTFSLDFNDLLLFAIKVLTENPTIREKWQNRFRFILVDEFQDTNDVEFHFLSLLLAPSTCLYIVGDPDQTIYTWRGANPDIIVEPDKKLQRTFETIVLDKNYRSTSNILDAANKLIANNNFRVPKDLYCENGKGDPIVVKSNNTHIAEAEWLAREIRVLTSTYGFKYSDIAVLYRSSYVTLDFEQVFARNQIPYRIYGGLKFYQRAEIKDIISYFRLVNSEDDDVSFLRIINVPRRGVGDATIETLRSLADKQGVSIYKFIKSIDPKDSPIPIKAYMSLRALITTLDKTREEVSKGEETYSKILEDMIIDIGYYEYLKKDEDGQDRLENAKALFGDLRGFINHNPEATFDEYLQNISLVSSQDEITNEDSVSFMTAHTAKGLEFPVVFVVRFNEGIFPHNRSLMERGNDALEEERRLAYVAFTRAKTRLYISFSCDFSYVVDGDLIPSRFITEAGLELPSIHPRNDYYNGYNKPKKQRQKTWTFDDDYSDDFGDYSSYKSNKKNRFYSDDGYYSQTASESNNIVWNVGDKVIHETLGSGVVTRLLGDGIIEVMFDEHGKKSILGNHPKVKKG
ncbi:MAG: UvrD-helicase domain-containing protein [Coprobacillus sp.]|nr:UvrD-helicase domain-containing protein [Coprobacillus sp.]